jgi:hypothetical protein
MADTDWLLAEGIMGAEDEDILWEAIFAAGAQSIDLCGALPIAIFECESLSDLMHFRLALNEEDVAHATDKGRFSVRLHPNADVDAARAAWRYTINGRGVERQMRLAAVFCKAKTFLAGLRAEVAARESRFENAPDFRP